jgi:hypothetical protein
VRGLVLDDHDGVADPSLGVGDGVARPREAHSLGRAEHRGTEVKRPGSALNRQAGVMRRYESGIGLGLADSVIRSSFMSLPCASDVLTIGRWLAATIALEEAQERRC